MSKWKTVASECARLKSVAREKRRVFQVETARVGTGWPHLREKGRRSNGGMLMMRKLRAPAV